MTVGVRNVGNMAKITHEGSINLGDISIDCLKMVEGFCQEEECKELYIW